MRKILFFAALFFLAACNSSTDGEKMGSMSPTEKDSTRAATTDTVTYPYKANYSSKFEIGDAKNAQTILNLWKAWDNGNLASMKEAFADSVEMHFSNGQTMKGSRDTILAMSQSFRDNYSKVESSVDAFMPLKSTDKNEQWVAVWGTEISTDKKGKVDSSHLQETWRLNNNGKVDLMFQYSAKALPQK
jgi:hypothetical protein